MSELSIQNELKRLKIRKLQAELDLMMIEARELEIRNTKEIHLNMTLGESIFVPLCPIRGAAQGHAPDQERARAESEMNRCSAAPPFTGERFAQARELDARIQFIQGTLKGLRGALSDETQCLADELRRAIEAISHEQRVQLCRTIISDLSYELESLAIKFSQV